MVIGTDLKAKRFMEYELQDDVLIFANDMSNSLENNEEVFNKEELEITNALQKYSNKFFVYFSSTSIYDPEMENTPYIKHRKKMESIITTRARSFLIFRIPQLVGAADLEPGLMNYLVDCVQNQKYFSVWSQAERNFLDVDDLFMIADHILVNKMYTNKIINVAGPNSVSVIKVVNEIEKYFGRKANYTLLDKGKRYSIDIRMIQNLFGELGIPFGAGYINRILKKYYPLPNEPKKRLSIVVPTYFEENGIFEFYRRTKRVLQSIESRFDHELIFVNDGSTDRTLEKLLELNHLDKRVRIINFSRNFGNQYAITAGLKRATGDAIVIIDDDLQDPPEVILNFISKWIDGYKVVYGVRRKRDGINIIFKFIAKVYYRILKRISDAPIPVDTGDFRLVDRVVVENLLLMEEESRFFRGLVSWVGFSQIGWLYHRDARHAGQTTFTLKKYIGFALSGLTGFSEKPLYFASYFGFIVTGVGFLFLLWIVLEKIFVPNFSIQGWSSLASIIIFFGGLQSLFTGIVGIYLGKVYKQVKNRPLFIVESEYGFDHQHADSVKQTVNSN